MKLVSVLGSGSNCGKTTLVCRILAAVPGMGAVKVSPRNGEARVEWGPGAAGKDTARYADSSAVKVARIIAPRELAAATWERIAPEFADCSGVVVEGGSFLRGADVMTILVLEPGAVRERPDRVAALAQRADLVVGFLPAGRHDGASSDAATHLIWSPALLDPSCPPPVVMSAGGSDVVKAVQKFVVGL